jgi:hypothetical protein
VLGAIDVVSGVKQSFQSAKVENNSFKLSPSGRAIPEQSGEPGTQLRPRFWQQSGLRRLWNR